MSPRSPSDRPPDPSIGRSPAYPGGCDDAIVLVHGAWVGAWSWLPILPALQQTGRPVHAVSLRGHGVRHRDGGPHVTLVDHVDDVVDVIDTFDLDRITLVGHSYGGRVVTHVWSRRADRVHRLVYLDAHAPLGVDAIRRATGHLEVGADGMVPFSPRFAPDEAEFGGRDAVEWFGARLHPQSAATLNADFSVDLPADLDRTYVSATGVIDSPFAGYGEAARRHPDWRHIALAGSHWLMVSHPDAVASIIIDPTRWGAPSPSTSSNTSETPS